MAFSDKNKGNCNEMVKVAVRCRPLSTDELLQGRNSVVKINPSTGTIEVYNPSNHKLNQSKLLTFDAVYDFNCTQQDIFDGMVNPVIKAVLDGFNCTVFAYGQTGTGKTYTMEGDMNTKIGEGMISKTFNQIFVHISNSCNIQYLVRMSYLEIYQDEIKDLLNISSKMKYELRENKDMGVYVTNLKSIVCKNVKQMEKIMSVGRENRTVGTTDVNEKSSRSHAIVIITVEMNENSQLGNRIRVGKLNLVDLAGSERQRKTHTEGKRLREASMINLSLSALGNVISALADNKERFIPYRDSKLTRLLKDSLGGNSKTLMIANISPACYNYDETLNTLRYASRARNIKNRPQVNEDPIDTLIEKYRDEIVRLQAQLANKMAAQREKKIRKEIEHEEKILSKNSNNDNDVNHHETELTVNTEPEEIEKEHIEELMRRIESLENALLTGTATFSEHMNKQQQTLDSQINKIVNCRKREKEMRRVLDLQEQVAEGIREEYTNLQHEVRLKSKKLLAMLRELDCVQQEIQDVKEDFNADRRDLEITHHELLSDLKLRLLINESFIPSEHRRRVYSRLYYDDDMDSWQARPEYEPAENIPKMKCATYLRRPTSLYALFTQRKTNHNYKHDHTDENREKTFRYKEDNILDLNLVYSLPTTKLYKPPLLSPALSSAFKDALRVEKDLEIDAASSSFSVKKWYSLTTKAPQNKITHESNFKPQNGPNPVYPKARGLVPK